MGGLVTGTGNARATLAVRGDDLYETPPVAVHALLRHEKLPRHIWECACGPGSIVDVLRAYGHSVFATDLVDYGCVGQESGVDFLMERAAPLYCDAVVTNPPFKLAGEFVAHAFHLGVPKIVMLLRLAFLESQRRSPILDSGDLARVLIFRKRLPFMHRAGYDGPKNSNSGMAFAWFIWDRDHKGPATLERISWEPLVATEAAA